MKKKLEEWKFWQPNEELKEMLTYIQELPEYDKDIFNKITGGLDND